MLFLLIELEVLVLRLDFSFITLALAARFISVALPVALIRRRTSVTIGTVRVLTWGGLRGGISVALALSLPEYDIKTVILAAAYAAVVFTIVVQRLTLASLVKRIID